MKRGRKPKSNGDAREVYDDLDAVKDIGGILNKFDSDTVVRIMRWVSEKYGLAGPVNTVSNIVVPDTMPDVKRLLRNPHEMNKPPLNKVIIQDDDDEGVLLGIPADRDVPEPEIADILKPHKETRRLVTVEDFYKSKDGSKVVTSKSLVMK